MDDSPVSSAVTGATQPTPNDANTTVSQLRDWMRDFVGERNWHQYHNAKNLTMSMAIETGELMEHFQWLTTAEVEQGSHFNRDEVADEMADVACYLMSLANALDIDLVSAMSDKMRRNRLKYPAAKATEVASTEPIADRDAT